MEKEVRAKVYQSRASGTFGTFASWEIYERRKVKRGDSRYQRDDKAGARRIGKFKMALSRGWRPAWFNNAPIRPCICPWHAVRIFHFSALCTCAACSLARAYREGFDARINPTGRPVALWALSEKLPPVPSLEMPFLCVTRVPLLSPASRLPPPTIFATGPRAMACVYRETGGATHGYGVVSLSKYAVKAGAKWTKRWHVNFRKPWMRIKYMKNCQGELKSSCYEYIDQMVEIAKQVDMENSAIVKYIIDGIQDEEINKTSRVVWTRLLFNILLEWSLNNSG